MSFASIDIEQLKGRVLKNRFVLKEILGRGGAGVVFAGFDMLVRRNVAIKVMSGSLREDPVSAARVHREMRAAHSIKHDNVVSLIDVVLGDDFIFLIIEKVDGSDLSTHITPDNQLSIQRCLRWLRQIATALTAIHGAGVIHRDLKPENVLIDTQGQLRVTDFGVVGVIRDAHAETAEKHGLFQYHKTEDGNFVGTPHYAAPECLSGAEVDQRSDLYSLGVMAYELLTGVLPHDNENLFKLISDKLDKDPVPPHVIAPDCPDYMTAFCMRLLKREPEARFQTAEEVVQELDALIKEVDKLAASRFTSDTLTIRRPGPLIEPPSLTFAEMALVPLEWIVVYPGLAVLWFVKKFRRPIELVLFGFLAITFSALYYYIAAGEAPPFARELQNKIYVEWQEGSLFGNKKVEHRSSYDWDH
jgi:serine/threonine protein kinase